MRSTLILQFGCQVVHHGSAGRHCFCSSTSSPAMRLLPNRTRSLSSCVNLMIRQLLHCQSTTRINNFWRNLPSNSARWRRKMRPIWRHYFPVSIFGLNVFKWSVSRSSFRSHRQRQSKVGQTWCIWRQQFVATSAVDRQSVARQTRSVVAVAVDVRQTERPHFGFVAAKIAQKWRTDESVAHNRSSVRSGQRWIRRSRSFWPYWLRSVWWRGTD
jgi:hypothetical protein